MLIFNNQPRVCCISPLVQLKGHPSESDEYIQLTLEQQEFELGGSLLWPDMEESELQRAHYKLYWSYRQWGCFRVRGQLNIQHPARPWGDHFLMVSSPSFITKLWVGEWMRADLVFKVFFHFSDGGK